MKVFARVLSVSSLLVLFIAAIHYFFENCSAREDGDINRVPKLAGRNSYNAGSRNEYDENLSYDMLSLRGTNQIASGEQFAGVHAPSIADIAKRIENSQELEALGILAQELAAIGSREAVEALIAAIQATRDVSRRTVIASAFQRLDNPDAVPAVLDGLVQISDDYLALAALRECAPRLMDTNGLSALLSALAKPFSNEWQISNLLGCLSEVQSPENVDMLVDTVWGVTNLDVREQSIVALAKIGNNKALAYLLDFLSEQSLSNTHEHILYMIGRIENKEAVNNLATVFLGSTNAELRYAAARALSIIQKTDQDEKSD